MSDTPHTSSLNILRPAQKPRPWLLLKIADEVTGFAPGLALRGEPQPSPSSSGSLEESNCSTQVLQAQSGRKQRLCKKSWQKQLSVCCSPALCPLGFEAPWLKFSVFAPEQIIAFFSGAWDQHIIITRFPGMRQGEPVVLQNEVSVDTRRRKTPTSPSPDVCETLSPLWSDHRAS